MLTLCIYPVAVAAFGLKRTHRDLELILIVIILNAIALAIGLFILSGAQGWRIADAISLVGDLSLGSKYLGLGSWEILVFFSQIWSQFLTPAFLIPSILGLLVLVRRRDRLGAVVLSWLVAASIATAVAAPMRYDPLEVGRGQTQIFRALFLTPFQIPSAFGLLFLKTMLSTKLSRKEWSRMVSLAAVLVVAIVFLAILNGTFRALFPLLLDPHNHPNPPWLPQVENTLANRISDRHRYCE